MSTFSCPWRGRACPCWWGSSWGGLSWGIGSPWIGTLALINLLLGLFNLIPAYPSDGGRVLRAYLTTLMGPDRGTQWALWIGRAVAVVLLGVAVHFRRIEVGALAVFLWYLQDQEQRALQRRRA